MKATTMIERVRPVDACAEYFETSSGSWQYPDAIHEAALDLFYATGFALPDLDDWIEAPPPWESEAARQHVMHCRQRMLDAVMAGNTEARDGFALYFRALMRHARREALLLPLARARKDFHGKGRAPDALGRWLDTELRHQTKATTAELWTTLEKRPPRGHVVEGDSFGGTLYQCKPWQQVCTRAYWRDRVRRARERARKKPE